RRPAGRPAQLLRRTSFSVPGLTALVFSPDSQLLATAAEGKFAALWRIGEPVPASPTRLAVVTAEDAVGAVTFSADGRLLACAAYKTALWDITNPSMPTQLAAFAHGYRKRDERFLWWYGLWLAMSNNPRRSPPPGWAAAFSPDGRLFAASTGTD